MIRREKDSKRVAKSVRDHSLTMEAFGRAASQPYDPNRAVDYNKSFTFVDGADIRSKSANSAGKPAKHWKNNVRKREKWERE